jgi:hypothetical protein
MYKYETMNTKQKLFEIIEKFLKSGSTSFPLFKKEYEAAYMDDAFESDFEDISKESNDYLAEVWSKAEWVMENPSETDLQDGYTAPNAFLAWLIPQHKSRNTEFIVLKKRFAQKLISAIRKFISYVQSYLI